MAGSGLTVPTDLVPQQDLILMQCSTQASYGVDVAGGHPEESGEYPLSHQWCFFR